MTTHTPGPLVVVPQHGSTGEVLFFDIVAHRNKGDKYRGPVASCFISDHIGGITRDEAEANAHLFKAAPDMLAALREAECALSLMQSYGHCRGDEAGLDASQVRAIEALQIVKSAIAATGAAS